MKRLTVDTKLVLYRTPEDQLEILDAGIQDFSVQLYIDAVSVENFYQGYAIMDKEKFSVLANPIDKNNIVIAMFNESNIYTLIYKKTNDTNSIVFKLEKNEKNMYNKCLYACGKIYLIEHWATDLDFNFISGTFAENLPKINRKNMQFCTKLMLCDTKTMRIFAKTANLLLEQGAVRIIKTEDGLKQVPRIYFYDVVKYSVIEYFINVELTQDIDEKTFKKIVKQNILKITDQLSRGQLELYATMACMVIKDNKKFEYLNYGFQLAELSLNYQFYRDMCIEKPEEFLVLGLGENYQANIVRGIFECYFDAVKCDKYTIAETLSEYSNFLELDSINDAMFKDGFNIFNYLYKKCKDESKLRATINTAIDSLETDQKDQKDFLEMMNEDSNMVN